MEQTYLKGVTKKNPPMLRVSVAMATYNGEKFIEEQLLSICRQTRKVDEIVISDDGSKDATLELVKKVSEHEAAEGIDFVVVTDNPRHGYCGNFEWAIKHTTGDLIFLSDQDDVWMPEKVERVCFVQAKYPDALCIIHNASMIDEDNRPVAGEFHRIIKLDKLPSDENNVVRIDRAIFLEPATSSALANGMVMCISRKILDTILPFPKTWGLHDCWIGFSAVCMDSCWYLSEQLAQYRLHGQNTCGNSSRKIGIIPKVKRIVGRIRSGNVPVAERVYLGKAMLKQLCKHGLENHIAYETALRVYEIGINQLQAFELGGITGAIKLVKLYFSDERYRRSGAADFLYQILAVLFKR